MPKEEVQKSAPQDTKITQYLKQYQDWRLDLKQYWGEMEKWQEMYEFYKSKSERSETDTNISLNTPFAIVESQIAKENQASINVTVKAKPDNDMGKFNTWIEAILEDAINDSDVAEIHGTFRKTKEKFSRSLKVVGNAVAEINYCYKTAICDGEKKVIADNPYTRTRSYKSVIFNPAMQLSNSDIYYIEDYVNYSDLTSQEYKEENGKGVYKNLGELKLKLKEKNGGDLQDDDEVQYISGDNKISRKNKPIQILTRWEGTKMTVFAVCGKGQGVVIRDEVDPHKLGGHNLLFGMRYVIEGRPYAYGEIAAIYKPVRAQDTIVAQGIEIVNRYLRGSYILGEDIDVDQFMLVLANGGAMQGNADSVKNVPVNTPPGAAFQQVDVLQQAIERAARFSLYGAGISGQATDKTQGTKGGIEAIQAGAEPNVEIQLDDIEEMFLRPVARKYLKMIGRLMGADETRYGLLKGESAEWVQATKGIILGKATLKDMLTVELIDEQQYQSLTTTLEPVMDVQGQPMVDPTTGQPMNRPVPIEGAGEAYYFDIDWIVDAHLDSQSSASKDQKATMEIQHVQWGLELGVPINPEKAWVRLGKRKGFEELDELLFSEDEQQQQQQQAMQQQEAQSMQQMGQEQSKQQSEQQQQQDQFQQQQQGKMELEALRQQGKMPQAA